MTHKLILLVALVVSAALPSAQTRKSADALAKELQAHYQSIRDFTADFVQTYRGGVLKTKTQESGTLAVKKPGKMRWTYTKPERKEFVSNGVKLYAYMPEDKQVTVSDVENLESTADQFLSGRGDIARDFTPSYVDTPASGFVSLKLVPRRSEPGYEYLIVTLDPVNLQIRALTSRDHQGGDSTLTFANMKENRGLSDKDFEFRPPRGVTVVGDTTR
jgi:outer membrane lipoprotein carrier protein